MSEKMKHHYAGLRRPLTDQTRAGVIEDFPEIELVPDKKLGSLCVEAWSYSLCCSDFKRIRDIPPWGNPNGPILSKGDQTDHLRGVVRTTKVMAEEFEHSHPNVRIDWDVLIAGAVCHDVGKPYEFDPSNRARWQADPADSGSPTFRHSVFGMHVCLTVGLPEEVAHIAVGHSFEGLHMGVSAECMIVRQADHGWWYIAGALGLLDPETIGALPNNLRARNL
jgi:hypothetical protein